MLNLAVLKPILDHQWVIQLPTVSLPTDLDRQLEAEHRQVGLALLELDFTSHLLGQDLARRQPNSDGVILHCVKVLPEHQLHERLEQQLLPLIRDPDARVHYLCFQHKIFIFVALETEAFFHLMSPF